jgi:type II secretory pathway predicted ATPase ExeA
MYEAFYKLSSDPFRLLPDPEICFPHRSCSKAWAYLRYALKRGEGIVVVTGPPGSGKTTLAERLLNELNPAKTVSVRLIANDLNPTDLLRKLAYSFGLPAEGMDRAMLAHRIERYLIELEHGNRQALVLIDEAQTLSHQSLEAMRLLTDLQSRSRPVLQLFLLGQEGLEDVMCAPGMVQFQQRVIASCRLEMMDLAETKAYIEYRLAFAEWQGDPSINGPAVMAVYRFSQGLPRHVNKICSRLLLHGCTEEKHSLKQRDVLTVVQDLREELLASVDEEAEVAAEIEGTAFGSVGELALVPALAPEAEEKRGSREELHALFLAEEQLPHADDGEVSQRPTNTGEGQRWRRGGGRYAYRVGYPRPYRFRRWVYSLFQIPRLLGSRVREWAREWGPVAGDFLLRVGRWSVASAARAGTLIRGWFSDGRLSPGELGGQLRSVSTVTVAGLGGLLMIGLALVLWSRDGGPQQAVAGAQTRHVAHSALPIPAVEPATIGPLILDGPSPRYVDVGELPAGAAEEVISSLGDADILARAAAELDLLGYRYGMSGDSGQLLLGGLTDNATEMLIRGAANGVTKLNIWSLADQAPEATDGRSAMPKATTDVSANGGSDAVAPAAAKAEEPSTNNLAEESRTDGNAADEQIALTASDESGVSPDPQSPPPGPGDKASPTEDFVMAKTPENVAEPLQPIAVKDLEELPGAVLHGADDRTVVTVAEAPVQDQVSEVDAAVEQSEVARLLALADSAMERDLLLRPKKNSAYSYLQAVLAIDPQNPYALSGFDRIVRRYGQMARWALGQGSFDRAERYVTRGLWVDPENAEMLELRNDVNAAVAELEAAKLAAAAPVPTTTEVTKPEPVMQPENNFDRLMRLVEGEN